MDILLMLLGIIIGLIMIAKGGDLFVDSSVYIARIAHISELIIGATIVSIGTTLPELFSSIIATMKGINQGMDDGYFVLAVSNAIGSMMCNSGLILALVFMIRPPRYDKSTFGITSIYVLVISILVSIFVSSRSRVNIGEGIVLVILFILFMIMNIALASKGDRGLQASPSIKTRSNSKIVSILSFVFGGIGIAVGAMLLVDNARALAIMAGAKESLVGITIVALGTSLPELVTAIISLRRRSSDIGIGNIMGAHIINGTLIIGIIALLTGCGIGVDSITSGVSVWLMLAIMVVLIIPPLVTHRTSRIQGVVMLLIYMVSMGINFAYGIV